MYSKLDVWVFSLDDRFRKLQHHCCVAAKLQEARVKTRRKLWFVRFWTSQRYAVLYDSSKASFLNGVLVVMEKTGEAHWEPTSGCNTRGLCEAKHWRLPSASVCLWGGEYPDSDGIYSRPPYAFHLQIGRGIVLAVCGRNFGARWMMSSRNNAVWWVWFHDSC